MQAERSSRIVAVTADRSIGDTLRSHAGQLVLLDA